MKTQEIAQLLRYYSLIATTKAGSGHPTSCLSAADLMAVLWGNDFFHYDIKNPQCENNDRLIFSKGHAAPLFYALWFLAGAVEEKELLTLRQFGARLEGHPTKAFPYTEVPTGSLGQGLSVGFGMALAAKYIDKLDYKTYVLLGDSELAEGQVWEALQLASYYKLGNLVAMVDLNRLGQRGETMLGHDEKNLYTRLQAFGWNVMMVDGHNHEEIRNALLVAQRDSGKPYVIIAKTFKGKGVSLLENQEGWHGKALLPEQLTFALSEVGDVDTSLRIKLPLPRAKIEELRAKINSASLLALSSQLLALVRLSPISTRKAYGLSLVHLAESDQRIIALDAEVSNSTYAEELKKKMPERFFEMFIAEQHMVSTAVGLAERGKVPFVSTFAAFFTRAADQLRMAALGGANIKLVGSHAGVSIGEDGASQMGLEDISLFRSLWNSVVLYPSDAVSAGQLLQQAAQYKGLVYVRMTRKDMSTIYDAQELFPIGGSKVLHSSDSDQCTIIGAGITLHEALVAYKQLLAEGIQVRVIDLYSIKPLDLKTLKQAAIDTQHFIVVEDHYEAGGIGEAVRSGMYETSVIVHSLAVNLLPCSGSSQELLEYERISARSIVDKVKTLVTKN